MVYVKVDEDEAGLATFRPTRVELGHRGDDGYQVLSGLEEGDIVVSRGALYIDSALQIAGQPGMMGQWDDDSPETAAQELQPQTVCPVMGGAINRQEYTDYNGQRIYFCCPPCIEPFNNDPEKYLEIMRQRGESPETITE